MRKGSADRGDIGALFFFALSSSVCVFCFVQLEEVSRTNTNPIRGATEKTKGDRRKGINRQSYGIPRTRNRTEQLVAAGAHSSRGAQRTPAHNHQRLGLRLNIPVRGVGAEENAEERGAEGRSNITRRGREGKGVREGNIAETQMTEERSGTEEISCAHARTLWTLGIRRVEYAGHSMIR